MNENTIAVTCGHLIRDIDDYRGHFADAGLEIFLPDICLLYTSPSPRD